MKGLPRFIFILVGLVSAQSATAYELATHAAITRVAFQRSNLAQDEQLIRDLGIDERIWNTDLPLSAIVNIVPQTLNPFGGTYLDTAGGIDKPRIRAPFEDVIMSDGLAKSNLNTSPLTLPGWLMRGAIREDDEGYWDSLHLLVKGEDPHDDPYGSFNRSCNHFYDPYFDRELTMTPACPSPGGPAVAKNPTWALGVDNAFAPTPTTDAGRRNHFSLADARETEYRALTGLIGQTPDPSTSEGKRNLYWATLFRALGDILHLNQDMAQPQHTRNEAHSGLMFNSGLGGHTSVYEKYIDDRVLGNLKAAVSGGAPTQLPPVVFDTTPSYPIPRFDRFSGFWSTSPGSGSLHGSGLADYSNQGFFTNANNFGDANMPSPASNPALYGTQVAQTTDGGDSYLATYLTASVTDSNIITNSPPIKMARESVWDAADGTTAVYALDLNVYDDQAGLLIPRAVAYSAGILNHFFRGKMAITLPDAGFYAIVDHSKVFTKDTSGIDTIRLKVQNVTPAIVNVSGTYPQDMIGGQLVAVVKFHRNTCYLPDLSGEWDGKGTPGHDIQTCRSAAEEIVTSPPLPATLNSGATAQEFQFDFSNNIIPINASDVYLQVVYRGPLGDEADAVAVATKDISEPTFSTVMNITGYVACVNGNWLKLNSDGSAPPGSLPSGYGYAPSPYGTVWISFTPTSYQDLIVGNPQIRVDNLQPFQYSRFAVLTDFGTQYSSYTYLQGVEMPLTYYFTATPAGVVFSPTEIILASGSDIRFFGQYTSINTTGLFISFTNLSNSPCPWDVTTQIWAMDTTASASGGAYAAAKIVPFVKIGY